MILVAFDKLTPFEQHQEESRLMSRFIGQRSRAKRLAIPGEREKVNKLSLAWYKNNPGKAVAKSVRRDLLKVQRVPLWADVAKIKAIYTQASTLGLTVDHITPLQGKLVSGLHVENNLQFLTRSENSRKGAQYEIQ
jgi:5-methylcytosine-specific restriction endonuclease McrA